MPPCGARNNGRQPRGSSPRLGGVEGGGAAWFRGTGAREELEFHVKN